MSKTKIIAAAAFVAGGLGLASAAQAAPGGPAGFGPDGPATRVADGCGPGFFRGPWGGCRPMGGGGHYGGQPMGGGYYGGRPFFAPGAYGRCFVRHTPWGPRQVCR